MGKHTEPTNLTFWENIATNSIWGKYINDIEKNTIKKAFQLIKNKNCVLEIGCDSGKWLDLASKNGFPILIGTDVNPNSEQVCLIKNKNIEFHNTNPSDKILPVKDNSIDLILVIEVIPVIHSEWFYNEARRVLKPNGIVVGVITNKLSLRGFLYNIFSASLF